MLTRNFTDSLIWGLTAFCLATPATAKPPSELFDPTRVLGVEEMGLNLSSPSNPLLWDASTRLDALQGERVGEPSFLAQIPVLPDDQTPDITPGLIAPQQPEALPEEPLPSLEELLQSPTEPPTGETRPEDIPGTIVVTQFEIIGSTVFSQEELGKALEEFTNRPITFAELLEAQEKVSQYYRDRGYITSGAFIPEQQLEGGIVKIEVIEGEIEEVRIEGLERLNPGYIRSRINRAISPPLNQQKLIDALQLLQLNPLIENFTVELAAGSRPGRSILDVQVTEANPLHFRLLVDNQRSPSVGSFRRKAEFSHDNVLGLGDRFNFSFVNTDGSNTIDNLSYTLPINPRNGTISFAHVRSRSRIIEEPFSPLDIQSASENYELTFRQPLIESATEDFALGVSFSRQESRTILGFLDIGPFRLSPGAEENGETKISALRFFQEYTQRSSEDVFAARSQFSIGVDWFNATINPNPPDSHFFAWRGQLQYLRLLAPDTLLLFRADFQIADRPLVPLEQFSAGGALSVRGYRQDLLLADNGFFASAEARFPILRLPESDILLQIAPFFDLATVWNFSDNEVEIDTPTISSIGVGLLLRMGRNFNARLDWGIPLVEVNSERKSWQENGIYFSVEYRI
ncbi:ShlB/FhaC/HecB family hemolysin secretion/activation protein [Lusitaniella coriacea]|uniref:ShlB/FhaC/HecB family hemolysin secretion/activation protein n=1 Tax=Lusitaniella coriacea TaxID=1983105 RepID=UPI003CF54ACE